MEALCALFDSVSWFGELISRTNDKDQELCTLSATVSSIYASVRAFVADMSLQERQMVFASNVVWPELLEELKKCDEVIKRNVQASEAARLEDISNTAGPISSVRRRLSNVSTAGRVAGRETLEAIGSKLGKVGGFFRLPVDELDIIRQCCKELDRLVPILQLAIVAHGATGAGRGVKRPLQDYRGSSALEPLSRCSRPAALAGDAAGGPGPHHLDEVLLQLVSDFPAARGVELAVLTVEELRRASAATASTSLETIASGGSESGSSPNTKVFGRQELRDKVPRQLTMVHEPGKKPEPFSRFVSRDHFTLEVLPEQEAPESSPTQDTLDMPTLAMGGITASPESQAATLAMGGASPSQRTEDLSRRPIAMAKGMTRSGLHLRLSAETMWRWKDKDTAVELHVGDRIALLLESPPGTYIPGPQRDLQEDEARCLLGVEFQRR